MLIEKWKTPIQGINKIDENQIFIKREDFIPISFGGNKARKAGYFFKEIDEGRYNIVITYGSSSSNHCRVVSNMAASRKIPCIIIEPEEISKTTFNSQMMQMFGAKIIIVPVEKVHNTIEKELNKWRERGKKPYFIAGGGHGNYGTQAYIDCYKEIQEYEKKNGVFFDYIFLASGTGTTQAGLICGKLLSGDDRKIIGISIARKNPRGRQIIIDSIEEFLGKRVDIEAATIFIDDYVGSGYGFDNSDIKTTIDEILIGYGIPMDSTYTGKAFDGMKKYIRENKIENKNILFIHTGGMPLFFDYLKGVNL